MPTYISNVDKQKKEVTLRLFGMIGRDVDGNMFARELATADEDADVINLHINCMGGDVVQGYSILSVMLNTKAHINVYVVGVAASMGAVIAVCGDKVYMYDYAKMMIHDPYFSGLDSSKLTPKEKKSLDSITDSLRVILSRRGKDKDQIAKLMKDETWFSAEEAKTSKLCDDVVSTRHSNQYSGLSVTDLMSRVSAEFSPNNNNNMMDFKAISKALGMAENATEQQIVDRINADKAKETARLKAVTDEYLERGVKAGLVTEKNKVKMVALANSDFDLFKDLVEERETAKTDTEGAPVVTDSSMEGTITVKSGMECYTRLSAALAGLKQTATPASAETKKTYDWYQKNDPIALAKMEKENPKQFKALLDAHEESFI